MSPQTNTNPASLSQNLATFGNIPYSLKFRTYFNQCTGSEGFVGVKLDGQPVFTVDACDFSAGMFHSHEVQFTASIQGGTDLRFEFLIFEPLAVVKIDNVSALPLH